MSSHSPIARLCTKVGLTSAVTVGLVVVAALGLSADYPEWVRNVETTGRFHDALYRLVSTPGGPIEVRRAPAEAIRALGAGADAELLALRARLSEEQLDHVAAERDWRAYASAATDSGAGQLALADFYHRRLLVSRELEALEVAARADDPAADRLRLPPFRRSWRTFERLMTLVSEQRLDGATAERELRDWIARFPAEAMPRQRLLTLLVTQRRVADLEVALTEYQRAFPDDERVVIETRATLALANGRPADALGLYDQAFRPLWSESLVEAYFALMTRTHNLRAFLDRARADIASRPDDLTPVARVFYYYAQSGNVAAAEQALADYEARRERAPRTAEELLTLARLYERTRNLNEALRYYASVYRLSGASQTDAETALASVISTLFSVPDQPLRFGSGDLSFYRDIATLDQGPGFLNGIWSLLFNSTSPGAQLAEEEERAAPYFRRARAAELLATFDQRFPQSARRSSLHADLIATYAAYGESAAVIAHGRAFLTTFSGAPQRSAVSLMMADAFATAGRTTEEFAVYNDLLTELARTADHVPLGGVVAADQDDEANASRDSETVREPAVRSADYARVLDRYIARLVSSERLNEALVVYRQEITRNPDDPGLYAATASFLEQNSFTAETERVYQQAIRQFPDRSWHHRLARWYLRQRRTADFSALTRDAVRTFGGTDLAGYFADVVTGDSMTAQMYLQLNLYAQQRFPHQLIFVRNLLSAYANRPTANVAARDTLLREHWLEDDGIADEWFGRLSASNRLEAELAALRPPGSGSTASWSALARENPHSARFIAEAEIWRSRFEAAAPALSAVSNEFPAERSLGQRASALHRSLSAADPREIEAAATVSRRLLESEPRDAATLVTLGEVYADHDQLSQARAEWNRVPTLRPGVRDSYLETATVFWDYYQFDDALRTIATARQTFAEPALFAYEAGAISEGLRLGDRAVAEYVAGALAAGDASGARSRLLTLARREAYRAAVDRASLTAAAGAEPSATAVALRVAVLEAQRRRADLEQFLTALVDRTSSLELMAEVGVSADRLGMEAVRTRALERQIAVMVDPIDKLQLRNDLVRLYESRGELALARRTLEAIYAEQPNVLGVVRTTADYYWRHELQTEAIDVLTRASAAAYPSLRLQFIVEAAQKSNESGRYAQARQLLAPLLNADPFNADYLAIVAQSYALAKQDLQLRDFYRTTIEAMRSAPLPADERTRRIAGLRRGLIPALERLQDHAGAIDQYIEVINRYPDDSALAQEAGRYARKHGRIEQLTSYYSRTAAEAPRDYRWPMLLAMLSTQFENYPAAIDAYAKAILIRPDRLDFHLAKAGLEERLMRFDEAVSSYERAYELSYRAPEWMLRVAELRARQGRTEDVVRALRTALIDGRPEGPAPHFEAAERLADWHLLDEARPFIDEGARRAGSDGLLRSGGTYVTVSTRLRQAPATFTRLMQARGMARPTDSGSLAWADSALREQLGRLGDVISRDYSPEEKVAFARFLDQQKAAGAADLEGVLLPLAQRAQLIDRVASWQAELMSSGDAERRSYQRVQYESTQTARLQFAALGASLEELSRTSARERAQLAEDAARAYRRADNGDAELRVLRTLPAGALDGELRERLFTLLLQRDPVRLNALASSGGETVRDAAASFVVERGSPAQALAVIRARGRGMPVVWNNAYLALVGMYVGRFDSATTTAFTSLLGEPTVEARMRAVDRSVALAGDVWFAYGSRYGEYLTLNRQPDADGYLRAELEHTPARSDAYVALADFYRDRSVLASALSEYDHAATINVRRSDVHLRAAVILWRQGLRDEAVARWQQAMELLAAPPTGRVVDVSALVAALDSIGGRQLLAELRDPADRMVRAYVARSGNYRADGLFRAAFRAAADPSAGADWLIDLLRVAPNQLEALGAVARAGWMPDALRDRVYERIETVAAEAVASSQGEAQRYAQSALERWRIERIRSLIDTRQPMLAAPLLSALPSSLPFADRVPFEARIAVANATFETWLSRYAADDAVDGGLDDLRNAATALRRSGEVTAARRVMEVVYTRQLSMEPVTPAVLLGLAEIRMQQANMPAALELLRRLTLVVGTPFEHLADAAALLERLNHPGEALEFRRARVIAVPWDASAKIALSRTEAGGAAARGPAFERLSSVAEDSRETYAARVSAARAFAALGGQLGRQPVTEIDYLRAPGAATPAAVSQPMFVAARLLAAQQTTDATARARLLREAVAISPEEQGLRVPLFRAELALTRPVQAIEAVQPTLRRSRSLNGLGITAAERSRLARELADAHINVNRLPDAVRFLTLALEGQTRAARASIEQQIATLNAEIARLSTNTARRPRISDEIDQPAVVRPRIARRVATQVAAVAPAPAQGGAR